MKKVLIVCGSGVTSYLLAEELNQLLDHQYYVYNANVSFALKDYRYFQLVLVAPQVSFMYEKIYTLCTNENIPCIKIAFNEYKSPLIKAIITQRLSTYEIKKMNLCIVKQDHSGYLAQLYANKMKESFQKQKYEVEICVMKYSDFQKKQQNFDYVLFEPQLMYQFQKKEHYLLIRSSDFHSLNVDGLVSSIIQ